MVLEARGAVAVREGEDVVIGREILGLVIKKVLFLFFLSFFLSFFFLESALS